VNRIENEITEKGFPPLPKLQNGEDFYNCTNCGAVWKASLVESSPSAHILGNLDSVSGPGWIPRRPFR
jgi:hypothetical protein